MKVTATELANQTKYVLDRVIQHGESAEIQRPGRCVAEIRCKPGVNQQDLLRILKKIPFSESESKELKKAMDAATDVVGYAGRD